MRLRLEDGEATAPLMTEAYNGVSKHRLKAIFDYTLIHVARTYYETSLCERSALREETRRNLAFIVHALVNEQN